MFKGWAQAIKWKKDGIKHFQIEDWCLTLYDEIMLHRFGKVWKFSKIETVFVEFLSKMCLFNELTLKLPSFTAAVYN